MRKAIWMCGLVLLFVTISYPITSFAHKMIVEHDEDGIIYVRYDDGTPATLANVSLYDENGNLLLSEDVNEDGYLFYNANLNVSRVVADDRIGHRATSTTNQNHEHVFESIPLTIRMLLGISILVFIAAIFYYRTSKTNTKRSD